MLDLTRKGGPQIPCFVAVLQERPSEDHAQIPCGVSTPTSLTGLRGGHWKTGWYILRVADDTLGAGVGGGKRVYGSNLPEAGFGPHTSCAGFPTSG